MDMPADEFGVLLKLVRDHPPDYHVQILLVQIYLLIYAAGFPKARSLKIRDVAPWLKLKGDDEALQLTTADHRKKMAAMMDQVDEDSINA